MAIDTWRPRHIVIGEGLSAEAEAELLKALRARDLESVCISERHLIELSAYQGMPLMMEPSS